MQKEWLDTPWTLCSTANANKEGFRDRRESRTCVCEGRTTTDGVQNVKIAEGEKIDRDGLATPAR